MLNTTHSHLQSFPHMQCQYRYHKSPRVFDSFAPNVNGVSIQRPLQQYVSKVMALRWVWCGTLDWVLWFEYIYLPNLENDTFVDSPRSHFPGDLKEIWGKQSSIWCYLLMPTSNKMQTDASIFKVSYQYPMDQWVKANDSKPLTNMYNMDVICYTGIKHSEDLERMHTLD